jgi:hypothetical protein
VFESRVLRRIFGRKKYEVMGRWRKLYNEELRDSYTSRSIIRIIKARRMRWAGHVARIEEKRNVNRLLVGKPEGKRPLRIPKRRWIENIKMDLYGIDTGGELLWTRKWTFGFHKMLGNYWVAAQHVASRALVSSTELVLLSYNFSLFGLKLERKI